MSPARTAGRFRALAVSETPVPVGEAPALFDAHGAGDARVSA